MKLKDFSLEQIHNANDILNQYAVYLKGNELTIYIHYWGGESVFKTNVPHKHSFFEVCYVVDGEGIYQEKGKEYSLSKGNLFISLPHVTHQIINTKDLFLTFFAFEPIYSESKDEGKKLIQLLSETKRIILNIGEENAAEKIWTSMYFLALNQSHLIGDTLKNLGSSLIYSIILSFLDKQTHGKLPRKNSSETIVYKAKLYIRDNISQPLRLKDVANNLHISGRHLSRLFTEELGVTYTEYVQNERIKQAIHLLTTTDLQIKEIAAKTGFSSVHYFTSVFKRLTGVTPGEFNKRLLSDDLILH